LQEWQISDGSVRSSISSNGFLTVGGSTPIANITSYAFGATQIPLAVRGAPSQTADLQLWQNSATATLARVGADGSFRASNLIQLTSGSVKLQDTGVIEFTKRSTVPGSTPANNARLYFRDGTIAGTYKLCSVGPNGTESVILDNMDQSGSDASLLGAKIINGGTP
jgi:hypothetical protein